MENELKKTPLYNWHKQAGGRIVPFAGYLLPVQYTSVINEHSAVRSNAGLFDVSHMGEIIIQGGDALDNINNLMTNDFTNFHTGCARYSLMCNNQGGIVDDVIVYNVGDNKYLIVVNASNKDKDYNWIINNVRGNVEVLDKSDETAQIALQGPNTTKILSRLTDDIPQKRFTAILDGSIQNIKCLISRTGYTGEDGFEIYCKTDDATKLWQMLITAGETFDIVPCGLGARDTLRFEATLPLYGHEMNDNTTPLEVGLGYFVKQQKEDFIGKRAMFEKTNNRKRIGLKLIDKGIARENAEVYVDNIKVGETTSGTFCPSLGGAYAMALVENRQYNFVEIDVRGKRLSAQKVDMPFYKRSE